MSGPIEIRAQVLGAEAVSQRLMAVTPEARTRVKTEVKRQGLELLRLVKQKLSDDVLHVRTGRLRRSINEQSTDDGNTFTSTTGTNVFYGALWEKGFDKKIGAGVRKTALSFLRTEKERARYFAKHPAGVKHQSARPFLIPSLAERKNEIRAGLVKAISGLGRPK